MAEGKRILSPKTLLERLERGELSRAGLEIAAHLGHSAARRALELEGPASESWLEGLSHWGKEPMIRAGIACAAWVLPTPLGDELRSIVDAVYAAATWTRDPSEANRVGARLAREELEALAAKLADGSIDEELMFELGVVTELTEVVAELRPAAAEYHFKRMLELLMDGLRGEEQVEARQIMRRCLLDWALGEGEPLDALD